MKITEEQIKMLLAIHNDLYPSEYQEGVNFGVEETLDILGIKVKGINDYTD